MEKLPIKTVVEGLLDLQATGTDVKKLCPSDTGAIKR
jgi:hypothetical protein